MQCGLIDYRAGKKRLAVDFSSKGQALKPGDPPIIKVSLDANLIESRLVIILMILG